MSEIRFDTFKIPKVTKTKEGFLKGDVVASRSGIFEYMNIDGSIRRELRHPNDVFKTDSLESLKMIPVTDNHPNEFVDSSNAHKYQVGFTGETYKVNEDKIITSITVTHDDVIEKILNGKLELSLGYTVDLIPEKGVYQGMKYDYRQVNPSYNHLAIVQQGRAGHDARFRFDSAAELVTNSNIKKEVTMSDKTENKDETELVAEKQSRIDSLISERDLMKYKTESLQKKLDSVTELVNKKDKELEKEKSIKADDIVNELAKERIKVFVQAIPFLNNDSFSYIHHSNREIMEAAIKSRRKDNADFTGKSDEYVAGVFETFVNTYAPRQFSQNTDNTFNVLASNCDKSIYDNHDEYALEDLKKHKVK